MLGYFKDLINILPFHFLKGYSDTEVRAKEIAYIDSMTDTINSHETSLNGKVSNDDFNTLNKLNFMGKWQGMMPVQTDVGLQAVVNSHTDEINSLTTQQGVISQLNTISKSNIVGAINEVKSISDSKSNKTDTDNLAKQKMEVRKIEAYHNRRVPETQDFSKDNLDKWDYTAGVNIASNLLNNSLANVGNHLNVAIYQGIQSARGIEATLGTGSYYGQARLGFGNDKNNFCFFNNNAISANNNVSYFEVDGHLLNAELSTIAPNLTFNLGDRIKVVNQGQNMQLFVNDVLTHVFTTGGLYAIPKGFTKALIAWRDNTAQYNTNYSKVKVFPKKVDKLMHYSFDDVIINMKDLTTNANNYSSLFQNDFFGFLKSMHDKYGAVFTCNLFYSDGTWNLGSMTQKFRNEFKDNANWLKFAFHAYDNNSNYGDGSITSATALTHYNQIITAIKTFASSYNIDTVFRTHYFSGSLDTVRQWRDNGLVGAKGFLTADDTRTSNMYLNTLQQQAVNVCDDLYDSVEKLYFIKTITRTFNTDLLDTMKTDPTYFGQQNMRILFSHEYEYPSFCNLVESACQWALANDYIMAFPMDFIPEC